MIDCTCEICGQPFRIYPADARKGGGYCCSILCRNRRIAARKTRNFGKRFWDKVFKTPDCWLWTGAKTQDGYGQTRVNGRYVRAHRFSWEIHHGPVPKGMHVLHRCDSPGCINPGHLWLGTDADNAADRNRKGRQAHGERSGGARLTEEIVIRIRSEYDPGRTSHRALARKYGVSRGSVQAILEGRSWKHLLATSKNTT